MSRGVVVSAEKPVATKLPIGLCVAKTKGEFVWHTHPDSDDFFLVVKGQLTIQLRD